ncbi:MAG: ELM1/GtrOC1 family putative glycosyltransferase [Gammaproteobacteria bacterium]|nr:ELM1/GtrOC1 family putative glycosyltransferase [Gammaproteobacteria bacterium]
MAFLTQRIVQSMLKLPATIRATQVRAEPDVIVLPVRAGVPPCGKPPVRIFLGTENAQYKAERVFIWSIEQVRDPARVYEIYLMKHFRGFSPRFWLTGFTNYRFAIPHFAGKTGRAIYNDVDQIYLKDPAELFDLDMNGHGYLAIDPGDISVALFDCEKMAQIWTLDDAQKGRKNPLLARASSTQGLWGKMAGIWNARDREYVPGQSGVLHYTAMHKQPWHPFPNTFVYQANKVADVWFDLEQSANDAGFQVFSRKNPSQAFRDLCHIAQDPQNISQRNDRKKTAAVRSNQAGLAKLLEECSVHTVLDCQISAASRGSILGFPAVAKAGIEQLVEFDPTAHLGDAVSSERVDATVCFATLDFVPDEDIPWLLKQLFGRTRRLVYCEVSNKTESQYLSNGMTLNRRNRPVEWWQYQFELVARHYPAVRWRLRIQNNRRPLIVEGNECNDDAVVWVIANQKPGHTGQAIALAETVGWPYQVIRVPQVFKSLLLVMLRNNIGRVEPLQPPWPNVIIACGWWPTRVARWIKMRSGGHVRLLLAGRKCGPIKSPTDILVSCKHFHLPIHERRIETLLPVHPITESRLDAARQRGQQIMDGSAQPKVALLVGGSSKQHMLTPADAASLGRRTLEQVQEAGGSLFAVTSRRTGSKSAEALAKSLLGAAQLYVWADGKADNPYLSYLAAADILVVTGESESMLMDAIATGKPVYIYPLRQRRYGPWLTLGAKLFEWSKRRPKNRRGTERPQQGFEYLCSRVLKREWILPPRDLDGLHRGLVESGLARMFGQPFSSMVAPPPSMIDDLGRRLRAMLAQPQDEIATQTDDHFSRNVSI